MTKSLTKMSMSELTDRLNSLRVAAGLPARTLAGTSKQTAIILINRAQRGEF